MTSAGGVLLHHGPRPGPQSVCAAAPGPSVTLSGENIWVSTKIFSINLAGSPRRRAAWARAWPRVYLHHLAVCAGADDPGDN